jgi:hypothetical protein
MSLERDRRDRHDERQLRRREQRERDALAGPEDRAVEN